METRTTSTAWHSRTDESMQLIPLQVLQLTESWVAHFVRLQGLKQLTFDRLVSVSVVMSRLPAKFPLVHKLGAYLQQC
eukprot:2536379-Amphidinium_carterae.1